MNAPAARLGEPVGHRDVGAVQRRAARAPARVAGLDGLRRRCSTAGRADARRAREARSVGNVSPGSSSASAISRRAMILVADERAGQGLRRPGQRPAHDGRRHAGAAENRPERRRPHGGRRLQRLRNSPNDTSACAKQKSGSRSTARRRPRRGIVAAERTPLRQGSLPVATAVQTGPGCVGRSVARCIDAPPSSRRPKFGSRPSATAGEMMSSEAASTASNTTRESLSRRKHRRGLQPARAEACVGSPTRARPAAARATPASTSAERREPRAGPDAVAHTGTRPARRRRPRRRS